MNEQNFIRSRKKFWDEFEGVINGGAKEIRAYARRFPRSFREITQDLNTAKAHGFDPALILRLNYLALEGNQILYGGRTWSLKEAAGFIFRTFPRTVRAQWRGLGIAHLIFYGLAVFFFFLCLRFPSLVYEIMPENQVMELENMYNPESSYYLTPRDVSSDADMFGFYIYNNVSIAFRTFAGGILAGAGSILILCFNGIFLGAAAGHLAGRGFGMTFFPFIIAHSAFELTAIVLSAQAGLLLGFRLFVTQGLSRRASIRKAGKTAVPLMAGSALLLVLAAAIEAFWSSRHLMPPAIRYGAGIAAWVLVVSYFTLMGREKHR
ncbi:MAG: stage II sporulation protein M [Spirochaetaceae bacterium]|nr:stage II sporulation protein M [Spirochaetaceae bacterium]